MFFFTELAGAVHYYLEEKSRIPCCSSQEGNASRVGHVLQPSQLGNELGERGAGCRILR